MRSDGDPGQTGDRENPPDVWDIKCPKSRMGPDPRNPSGPAAITLHKQAEHKTVPDLTASELQKNPCTAGAIHTRHRAGFPDRVEPWLVSLLERKPVRLATIAMANKTARIVWAVLTRNEPYKSPVAA